MTEDKTAIVVGKAFPITLPPPEAVCPTILGGIMTVTHNCRNLSGREIEAFKHGAFKGAMVEAGDQPPIWFWAVSLAGFMDFDFTFNPYINQDEFSAASEWSNPHDIETNQNKNALCMILLEDGTVRAIRMIGLRQPAMIATHRIVSLQLRLPPNMENKTSFERAAWEFLQHHTTKGMLEEGSPLL